ncbi:TlpA family protein disulfide reductase [Bosea massiliensis]|jgi:thiol-disulfide isomerase/thioredoxin|uniref:TlpA family protein disulfide reductase n=1 Tax=Bosea massiliensis TaxID=151419 RepID=A0ABW0P2Q9_9HYPH
MQEAPKAGGGRQRTQGDDVIAHNTPGRYRLYVALAMLAIPGVVAVVYGSSTIWSERATPVQSRRALDLKFERADGRSIRLAELRGKAILLNIWATWCLSCRTEMPSLDRLQGQMGSKAFEVVALSVDRDGAEVVKPFYSQFGIKDLTIYLDREGKAVRSFKITGLPTTLLLGPDGAEVLRWVGPKEWDSPELISEISRHVPTLSEPGNRGAQP